ncbi:MAG: hypothetical protein EKK54_06435 [Neisseriaceae bacterium]|nr:MAG: hypothetical protein EKK54_06435 [Neisseriaceae bacterium]
MSSIEFIQRVIYSLAIALLLVYSSGLPKRSLFLSCLAFCLLILGINFIPLYRGSSLIELLRGVTGDVSIASGALMLAIIANQFDFSEQRKAVLSRYERLFLLLIGCILYLSTFSFISFDVYHLGYLSVSMLIVVALIIFALILYNRRMGYVWLLALLGFYFQLQSSNNLWDYLYDPLLWLVLIADTILWLNHLLIRRDRKHEY